MPIRRAASILVLASAVLLAACQSSRHRESMKPADSAAMALDQGYALFYSTIDDESKVDQVLIIKDPSLQVAELIKAIGQFSRDTRTKLQVFADEDPALNLDNGGLPEVDAKTRDAISNATSKQIVLRDGKEFEFRILLTQHEALNYITYLAETLSKQEIVEVRKRNLAQLSEESKSLQERVIAQLQAPYVGQAK